MSEVPDFLPEQMPEKADPTTGVCDDILAAIEKHSSKLSRVELLGILEEIKIRHVLAWMQQDRDEDEGGFGEIGGNQ